MAIRIPAAALLLGLAPLLASSPGIAAPPAPAAPAQPTAVAAIASEIAPHRAIYRMALKSARSGSKVNDVRGSMLFEWADACDGWTTEQRFQLRFVYAEGEAMNMTTTYATWEAKDGQRYRFNVRKLVNGELDEEVRGDAALNDSTGGVARFAKPDEMEMPLPVGTMFPTTHTLAVLDHARREESFFSSTVFDGADAEGTTEISAVIGRPGVAGAPADPLLRDQKAWSVRLAFFPADSDSAAPEYEMGMRLLRNGVAESMVIDYGDFAVDAVLEKIEALPKSGC